MHAIFHAHLIPKCPHADLFARRGRDRLARQPVPTMSGWRLRAMSANWIGSGRILPCRIGTLPRTHCTTTQSDVC